MAAAGTVNRTVSCFDRRTESLRKAYKRTIESQGIRSGGLDSGPRPSCQSENLNSEIQRARVPFPGTHS